MTLLQATAITERWGPTHCGHLSGILSAPVTIMSALAPWIGAVLAGLLTGYAAVFIALGLGVIAALAALISAASRLPKEQH
jgi:MFS family permease